MQAVLLDWYDRSGRELPWRIRPEDRAKGRIPDPYAVWLSEIMLQQTTGAHATPYWRKFLDHFPTVSDLANADRDRVLTLWAGLGYYARARNLHQCAQIIRDEHGGIFPKTESELLKLPGIGPYTGATIAAICFDEPTNIVDGNVERVISRIFALEKPLPKAKSDLRKLAAPLASQIRPGDYGQAIMDLGSVICSPTSPKCEICVWQKFCQAYDKGTQTDYPKKIKKKPLPIRYGAAFVLYSQDAVLLERRPDQGLLGGMMGVPGTEWGGQPKDPLLSAPVETKWQICDGEVHHVFTHFELRLKVYVANIKSRPNLEKINGEWASINTLENYALPTVMKKVLDLAKPG